MSEFAHAERRTAPISSSGATTGALADSLNDRASVREQMALGAAVNRAPVLQAKWEASGEENVLKWDSLRNGLQWYYDSETENMWFEVKGEGESREDKLALQGEKMSYAQWLDLIWGERTKTFNAAVAKGKERYERLVKTMQEKGAGALGKGEQEERDVAFAKDYVTTPNKHDENQLESVYRGRTAEDVREDFGKYRNIFELDTGVLTADHNYAAKAEKLSNSEILFQQWKKLAASKGHKSTPPVTTLERRHISGPGREIAAAVARGIFGEPKVPEATVFTPPSEAFYALLAMPNSIAALWLAPDHGVELGIDGIESITLLPGLSIDIAFRRTEDKNNNNNASSSDLKESY